MASKFHAVVLVLDQGKDLLPLVSSDLPSALLPVANSPAISYCLRLLDVCQISGITIVVSGKTRALQLTSWIAQEHPELSLPLGPSAGDSESSGASATPNAQTSNKSFIKQVLVVPETFGSADAVRAVLSQNNVQSAAGDLSLAQNGSPILVSTWSGGDATTIPADADSASASTTSLPPRQPRSEHLLVLDASVISDINLGAVAAAHCRAKASVTTVLIPNSAASTDAGIPGGKQAIEAASKDKSKTAADRDLIGLDTSGKKQLVVFSGDWKGPGKGKDKGSGPVNLPRDVLEALGGVALHLELQDSRIYAFDSLRLQQVLQDRPRFSCLRKDVLPFLVQQQWQEQRALAQQKLLLLAKANAELQEGQHIPSRGSSIPGTSAERGSRGTYCCAYLAPRGVFWRKVTSLPSYADANHALLSSAAVHLTGREVSQANNVVHPSVVLGTKSAVGAQCMVGEGTHFGEKCSVKRSLLGRHCRVGSNVKISDCVIMDYVTLENGCSLQGCVVSSHATVKELRVLKDCRVGPHYVVASDEKDSSLPEE